MISAPLSCRLFRASVLLLAGAALLANGPMGGGGSGGPPHQGGQGPMMPPDFPMDVPGSDVSVPPGPDANGSVPYPPSGPDQSTRLVNQINQISSNGHKMDEQTFQKCDALRQEINRLENGGGVGTRYDRSTAAKGILDRYSSMSVAEMDAELAYQKTLVLAYGKEEGDGWYANLNVQLLTELKRLRERYGNGYVYQSEVKGTDWAKDIQNRLESAALSQRDEDEPRLRDAKAEYAELNC